VSCIFVALFFLVIVAHLDILEEETIALDSPAARSWASRAFGRSLNLQFVLIDVTTQIAPIKTFFINEP
jgi:hypothetical protein